jgi:type III restriction enzyme
VRWRSYPFQFDANQEYQLRAIEAVAGLFRGQPRIETRLEFAAGTGFAAVPNRLDLSEDTLLRNLREVQEDNGIAPDAALQHITQSVESPEGTQELRFPNFSVEMESGTGKTYVYPRTVLELFRRYGMRKFIVVVPLVAVREGVLKTLEITEAHFREHFDNLPYRYCAYDSANLSQVRQFALSDMVEILVMTIDSFNKASNVIHQNTDRLPGVEVPIHLLQAVRPVLILDEPQNFESEARIAALAALHPLCALRYSATHRNPYNVVYRLTPFVAYRQGLVKRIEVAGVEQGLDANQVFLRLEQVATQKNRVTARLAVHRRMANGTVREATVTVGAGDRLEAKTGRSEYAPWVVEEIRPGEESVLFTNGIELRVGEERGAERAAIFEEQIRYTVEEHLRRQARLDAAGAGVKVLTLFFIDRVANYLQEDGEPGLIRRLFEQAYEEARGQRGPDGEPRYPRWRDRSAESVQGYYFARRRTRGGEVILEDTRTGEAERDREAYDLILKNKERPLSFEEPTCFIFSHSALREGWDNPTIFQICTLNQTASEMKKRQEIGRGVRLAVNQRGERIRHKTRYAVRLDTERLVAEVVEALDRVEIRPPDITVRKARVQAERDADRLTAVHVAERHAAFEAQARTLPNLLELMAEMMDHTTPRVRLTRRTLLEIFRRTETRRSALLNPQEFAAAAVRIIKQQLAAQMVDGIRYERIGEAFEMRQFDLEIESFAKYLIPAEKSLYDHVVVDTLAGDAAQSVEGRFVAGLETWEAVKLYVKLPSWFIVETPLGDYNPDRAVVVEPRDDHGDPTGEPMLYLVTETKAEDWRTSLPRDGKEWQKIRCGARHFGSRQLDTCGALEGVDYCVAGAVTELQGLTARA